MTSLPTSQSGKSVTAPTTNFEVDGSSNLWEIIGTPSGSEIVLDGQAIAGTAGAAQLLVENSTLYYKDKSGNWYFWLGSWFVPCADPTTSSGAQAVSADLFVDSIGVADACGSIWPEASVWPQVEPFLTGSGIRHVRVGAPINDSAYTARLVQLAQAGLKFNILTDPTQGNAAAHLAAMNSLPAGCIASIEGVNEPDGQYTSQVPDWVSGAINWQQQLAAGLVGTPYAALPLLSPALINEGNVPPMKPLIAASTATNAHCYPGDRAPETGGWGDNGYGSMGWTMQYMMPNLAPWLPVYATETGYSTSGGDIPPACVGTYMPRLLLNRFMAGVRRTFIYELYDQQYDTATDGSGEEANFGLLTNSGAPGGIAPKPAYTAIKNLIALMADAGPAFPAGRLNFSLGGSTANLASALFQKRDGSFILALCQAVEIWNPNNKAPEPASAEQVTVTVSGVTQAQTAVPINAGTWSAEQALSGGAITLPIGADLTLVRFS